MSDQAVCSLLPSPYLDSDLKQWVVPITMRSLETDETFTIRRPFGQVYQYRMGHVYARDVLSNKTIGLDGLLHVTNEKPLHMKMLGQTPFANPTRFSDEQHQEMCLILSTSKL